MLLVNNSKNGYVYIHAYMAALMEIYTVCLTHTQVIRVHVAATNSTIPHYPHKNLELYLNCDLNSNMYMHIT